MEFGVFVEVDCVELSDIMVTTSQNKKENSKRVEGGGAMGEASQPSDIEPSKERAVARLRAAYQVATEQGSYVFDPPLDVSLLIGSNGQPSRTFPLVDGRTIGEKCGVGLPTRCSQAQVELAEQVAGSKDVWLTLSAIDKDGERRRFRVLLVHGKTGRKAIRTEKDVQSDALKEFYEQVVSGSVTKRPSLDISLLIGSSGTTQTIFPLLDGRTIGKQYSIGLPKPCSQAQVELAEQVAGSKDVWLTLSAIDKEQVRRSSRVLLVHGKTGREAIRTEQDVQADALKDLYAQTLSGSVTSKCPLDISLLIGEAGTTQMAFPLLDGRTTGKQWGVGLPQPCSQAQVELAEQVAGSKDVWLTLSAIDKDGERRRSRVLLVHGKTGREAIRTEQDVQSDALKELYEQAESGSVTKGLPLDISLLISSYGKTQKAFPLSYGRTIGKDMGIGLPQDISRCKVTEILHLAEDRFCLTISGNLPSGVTAATQVVVSSSGIIRPVEIEPGVEIAKGHTLDRYVAHLLAVGNIVGESNPLYHGSALTGERFMPNAVTSDTIVHSKWGNSGSDVLEYVQRYARLRLWNNDLRQALHLVATTKHLAELREAIEALEEHVSVNGTGITDIETWCSEIPGLDRATIHEELKRISVMASIGDIDWLRGRTYEPTLPSVPRPQSPQSTAWQERVLHLAQDPELLEALKLHSKHHSLYWERSYHLDLVRHCSYLIDQVLASSPLSDAQKDEARQLVYQIYPELKRCPDAWLRLEESRVELVETQEGGDGSPPYLVPFDLARELARCGVKETVSLVPVNEIDWGHAKDVGPKVHDLFRHYSRIEDALKQLLVELKGQPKDTCNRVSAACLEWIAAAVLDVGVSDCLPPSLTRAKGAADQTSIFLQELTNLSPETELYYVSEQQQQGNITAQLLMESLVRIMDLGGLDSSPQGQM